MREFNYCNQNSNKNVSLSNLVAKSKKNETKKFKFILYLKSTSQVAGAFILSSDY